MKKVSIIVPVYNVEKYIKRCLDSLVGQTLDDIEIIIVNDGSPDNSQNIIDEYVKKYPKMIKSYIKENNGQGSARNLGIKKATGEYLGFVDSDDFIELDMFEKMYNLAKQTNSDIVTCNYKIFYEASEKIENYDLEIDNKNIVKEVIIKQPAPWNKIIKREIFAKYELEFPEGIIYEDYALMPLIGPLAHRITHLNECLYYYVVRENSSMTQNKFNKKFHNIITATEFLFNKIKDDKLYQQYYDEYEYVIICNLLRESYIRLKGFNEAEYILLEIIDWLKQNMPKWYKNKYYKKRFNFREKIYNYLVYKKKYKWLGFGKA